MRWTRNDTAAYAAVTDAGERLRKTYDESQAGAAFTDGSRERTETESNFGAVDPNAAYVGEGADGQMTNAEAASFGVMQPATETRRYGAGDNPKWQDAPLTKPQFRAAGLSAQADWYAGRGDSTKASAMYDQIDQMDIRGLQRKELDRASSIRDQQQAVMDEHQKALEAARKGDFKPFRALAERDYNGNVPGLDDKRQMHFLPDDFVAVTDPKTGYGQTHVMTPELVGQALEYSLRQRLAAISPEAWQAERKHQEGRKDRSDDVRHRERVLELTEEVKRAQVENNDLRAAALLGFGMRSNRSSSGDGSRSSVGASGGKKGDDEFGLGRFGVASQEKFDKALTDAGMTPEHTKIADKDGKEVPYQVARTEVGRVADQLARLNPGIKNLNEAIGGAVEIAQAKFAGKPLQSAPSFDETSGKWLDGMRLSNGRDVVVSAKQYSDKEALEAQKAIERSRDPKADQKVIDGRAAEYVDGKNYRFLENQASRANAIVSKIGTGQKLTDFLTAQQPGSLFYGMTKQQFLNYPKEAEERMTVIQQDRTVRNSGPGSPGSSTTNPGGGQGGAGSEDLAVAAKYGVKPPMTIGDVTEKFRSGWNKVGSATSEAVDSVRSGVFSSTVAGLRNQMSEKQVRPGTAITIADMIAANPKLKEQLNAEELAVIRTASGRPTL